MGLSTADMPPPAAPFFVTSPQPIRQLATRIAKANIRHLYMIDLELKQQEALTRNQCISAATQGNKKARSLKSSLDRCCSQKSQDSTIRVPNLTVLTFPKFLSRIVINYLARRGIKFYDRTRAVAHVAQVAEQSTRLADCDFEFGVLPVRMQSRKFSMCPCSPPVPFPSATFSPFKS